MEDVHVQYWRLWKMYSVHNSLHTAQYPCSSYGRCTCPVLAVTEDVQCTQLSAHSTVPVQQLWKTYMSSIGGYGRCTVYTTLCTQHSTRAAVMEDEHVQYWRLRKMYSVHNSLHTAQYPCSSYGRRTCPVLAVTEDVQCTQLSAHSTVPVQQLWKTYMSSIGGYGRCTVYTTLWTQHSDGAAVMEDVQVHNFVWRLWKVYSVPNSLHTAQYSCSYHGRCTVYTTLWTIMEDVQCTQLCVTVVEDLVYAHFCWQ